jgi:hypothetical protein
MLYRIYNVVWLTALGYAFLQIGFSPIPDRKYAVYAILGLLVFRYVVRIPTALR